jgi:beta-1,4-mannosyltransferase
MIETVIEVTFYISTAVTLFIFMLPSQYEPTQNKNSKLAGEPKTTVQVLVLGDIGRSPRMQYHALSIAQGGGKVDLIGYHGNQCFSVPLRKLANVWCCRFGGPSRYLFEP